MRVLIEDMIYLIKDAQFLDDSILLFPEDSPFLFRIPFDEYHSRDFVCHQLLQKGYLVAWADAEKEFF